VEVLVGLNKNPTRKRTPGALLMWLPAWAGLAVIPVTSEAIEMQQAELDNGMKIIVVPDHRSPVVLHSVWFRAGSMDEPTSKTGIAHMLEHLMFKGTEKLEGKEREMLVARHGAQENAFTSRDYTAYYQKVAKEKLPLMMELEADRMANLSLTEEDFLPERAVVSEERRLRTESQPLQRFYEKIIKVHYEGSNYEHPVIGWRADIEGYELKDAVNWYKTHYAPNNATMILVGDMTMEEALPLVEKYYGDLRPAETPARQARPLTLREKAQRMEETDKDVQVPVLVRFYRAPSTTARIAGEQGNPEDAAALSVMAEILGGSTTGRLYRELVKKQELADSAYADYDPTAALETTVDVFLQPKPGVTLTRVEQAADAVIDDMVAGGVMEEELARAKTGLVSDEIYARDDSFHTVYRLGIWLMAGGKPAGFNAWVDQVQAVTQADVQRVAQQYLKKARSTTGLLAADKNQL
jgi:zinc protease